MFRLAVILVHVFLIIFATLIGLGGKYSPAPPEPGKTYGVLFSVVAIFNIFVIVSAFVQLKVKKVWVFLLTVVGFIIFFIYLLPHIVFYIEGLL